MALITQFIIKQGLYMIENSIKMNRSLGGNEDSGGGSIEKGNVSISLDNEKIQIAMWGQSIEAGISELVKIFDIMESIKQQDFSEHQIKGTAQVLFDLAGLKIFKYEDIFTDTIIYKISKSKIINDLSVSLNGRPIKIISGATGESILKQWEGNAKPEDISKREAREKEKNENIILEQREADKMFNELENIDLKNIENALNWLNDYEEHVSWTGVDNHKNEVLKKFEANGYDREMNNITDFMIAETLNDKQRMGKAMVAYMLVNMGLLHIGHNMKVEIEKWKKIIN